MTCKYKTQCTYELKENDHVCNNGGSSNCILYLRIESDNSPKKQVWDLSHVFEGGLESEISSNDTSL